MRLILVVIIWIVIVGGMWTYVWQRDASVVGSAAETPIIELSSQQYSLEITPTFSVEEDPFALNTSDTGSEQLELRLNGKLLTFANILLERGQVQLIDNLKGVVNGHNEIYLKASPPVSQFMLNHGIRVRLLENGAAIVDHTIWNSQGSLVSGTIAFETGLTKEDDHDH